MACLVWRFFVEGFLPFHESRTWCGGLGENGPYSLMYLNAYFIADGTVWVKD